MNGENITFTVWPHVLDIKVARLEDEAVTPTRKHKGDAGIDLYSSRNSVIKSGEIRILHTGITIEIPPHFFGLIKPKSGDNFDVFAGVVDAKYQGEILVKIYNPMLDNVYIRSGDPIAQMIIIPIITPEINEVGLEDIHKEESERGDDGGITRILVEEKEK